MIPPIMPAPVHLPAQFFFAAVIVALAIATALRFWLSGRQVRAVIDHRAAVPTAFAGKVPLTDHQKAADYTVATVRLGRLSILIDAIVTLALSVGGGIGLIDSLWQ